MRDVGTIRRRIRQEAASTGGAGGTGAKARIENGGWKSLYAPSIQTTPCFAVQKRRIVEFQQDFNHKERKEHRDKNLWRFFFAIFVFFAVNSFLVAACRSGHSPHFAAIQSKCLSMNNLRAK
jgi:hypothetical protein